MAYFALNLDIHAEYKDESRVVMMDALTGEEMVALIDKTLPAEIISKENQLLRLCSHFRGLDFDCFNDAFY